MVLNSAILVIVGQKTGKKECKIALSVMGLNDFLCLVENFLDMFGFTLDLTAMKKSLIFKIF